MWHYEFFKKQAFPNVDRLTGYTFLLVVYFDQLLGAAHTQKLAKTLFGGCFQPLFDDEQINLFSVLKFTRWILKNALYMENL